MQYLLFHGKYHHVIAVEMDRWVVPAAADGQVFPDRWEIAKTGEV